MFDPLLVACRLKQPRDRTILVGQFDKSRTENGGWRRRRASSGVVGLADQPTSGASGPLRCRVERVERVSGVGLLGPGEAATAGFCDALLVEQFRFSPLTDEARVRFPGGAILRSWSTLLSRIPSPSSLFAVDTDAVAATDGPRDVRAMDRGESGRT
jgi:hypothetical protein